MDSYNLSVNFNTFGWIIFQYGATLTGSMPNITLSFKKYLIGQKSKLHEPKIILL